MTDEIAPARLPGFAGAHLDLYLRTNGAEGQFFDFTAAGGSARTPCLILKTKGRKSGAARLLPLIYGEDGGDYVIVASNAGKSTDPSWFLNLQAEPEVAIQVGPEKYRAVAHTVTDGAERTRLFGMMSEIYPPYVDYQTKTDRRIPVVRLHPAGRLENL